MYETGENTVRNNELDLKITQKMFKKEMKFASL